MAALAGAAAVGCLAVATGGWLLGPARWPERVLFVLAPLALLVMTPFGFGLGAAAVVTGTALHLVRRRRAAGVVGSAAAGS